jgi:hypothetical protein
MTKENSIKLFESKKIRVHWDDEQEKWYFSVIDIIETLTGSNNPRRYWSDLKRKLIKEGFNQLYEIIVQLKLESSDSKKYVTDCSDTEGLLRIIQSIPSPKAEPFKLWLAKVGYERIEETEDPELAFDNKQYRCSGVIRSASGDKSAFRHFQRWTETRSKIPADTILRRVDLWLLILEINYRQATFPKLLNRTDKIFIMLPLRSI